MSDRFNERQNNYNFLSDEDFNTATKATNICACNWNVIENSLTFSESFHHWFDFDIHYLNENASALFPLVHSDDINLLQKEISYSIKHGLESFTHDFRIQQNEVDYIWINTNGKITYNANQKAILFRGIIVNITPYKQNSIELEVERNNMNNLISNMSTGFALHHILKNDENKPIDYEFIYVNPAYEILTGLNTISIIGQKVSDVIPDLESLWIERYGKVAIEGGTTHFTQYSKPLKKHFDIIAYQTEPDYFAVIFSDVTEKKQSERAMAQADKMSSIGQLAGGIAHDFNNHLQIIHGYSEIIELKLRDNDDSVLLEYIDKIQASVKHSSHMIKQLLAFSKDDHYVKEIMDFHNMLHQTKDILSFTLNKNIHIQMLLDASTYQLVGDDSLLQNAIINICLNSRDALQNGGIISIMTKNIIFSKTTYIGIAKLEPGNYIKCSLRDNGIGIESDDLLKVFEPFYTTKANKGTGMGLAAVFGTIKQHQGAIEVTSQLHEWTQFDIYLPTSTVQVSQDYTKKEKVSEIFIPYKILLVDDEHVITKVVSQYLTEIGHTVVTFNNPHDMLASYNSSHFDFDIAILDVIMPEMNGFELLSKLLFINAEICAVFLSGHFNNNDVPDEIKSNILDYIEKPVNLVDLGNRIQRLLSKD